MKLHPLRLSILSLSPHLSQILHFLSNPISSNFFWAFQPYFFLVIALWYLSIWHSGKNLLHWILHQPTHQLRFIGWPVGWLRISHPRSSDVSMALFCIVIRCIMERLPLYGMNAFLSMTTYYSDSLQHMLGICFWGAEFMGEASATNRQPVAAPELHRTIAPVVGLPVGSLWIIQWLSWKMGWQINIGS